MNEHKNNQLIADKLNNIKHNLRKIDQKGLEVSKFYLSGIVSLGRECGNKEYPGKFNTRLIYFKTFLNFLIS